MAIALLVGLTAAPAAWAACNSGLAGRMAAKLHPQRPFDEQRSACRSWSGLTRGIVVALALPRPPEFNGVTEYDLDLMVLQQPDNGNVERSAVIYRLLLPSGLVEGEERIEDVRIDTARFQLAPDLRAFGLKVRYRGTSGGDPSATETLRLFVPTSKGGLLRQVLAETELQRDRGTWGRNCTGGIDEMRTIVSTDHPASPAGAGELRLTHTWTARRAQWQDDGTCGERPPATTYSTTVLRYDGERLQAMSLPKTP